MWPWPEELDAVMAAPLHHRLAMDHDSVRVLETLIKPGEIVALHTHRWPAAAYVLSWSDFVRRDEHGQITLDTREAGIVVVPGQAIWTGVLGPHTLENVGSNPLHLITVEVKNTLVASN